ncbi:MAG: hypothetical protein IJ778_01025 [Alphaproteobacteria bacterium]|nr:hypothetical protein [Alphaproteobacteria bacterium]
MVDFSGEFKEFLKKYNSSALAKVEDSQTPPDVLNSIYNEYVRTFEIWEKLPQTLRDRYDIVPQDIMDAAARGEIETLRTMENDSTLKTAAEAREKVDEAHKKAAKYPDIVIPAAVAVFATAAIAGYSDQASHDLAIERQFSDDIWEKAKGRKLTDEEVNLLRESRKRVHAIISKDWAEHQPEKMLVRMFARLNRHPEKKDEFLPKIADLIQKIETENRQGELLKYLNHPVVQSKLSRFSTETLDLMNTSLLKNVPAELQNGYLANTIPLKIKMAELADTDITGKADIQARIHAIVQDAKENGIGIDFKNYLPHSPHPMSADVRQQLMIACCVNGVPYRSPISEKINLNSEYFKSLPADVQTLVASREIQLAKEQIVSKERVASTKELYANMPSIMAMRGGRE